MIFRSNLFSSASSYFFILVFMCFSRFHLFIFIFQWNFNYFFSISCFHLDFHCFLLFIFLFSGHILIFPVLVLVIHLHCSQLGSSHLVGPAAQGGSIRNEKKVIIFYWETWEKSCLILRKELRKPKQCS